MQIIDNKALLFVTKNAEQITSIIPKSKILETRGDLSKVLVNWGHTEAKLLRNMNIKDVPHPILGRYDWPGVYTPFAHQKTTAEFLVAHHRCLNLSEAGTGKTSAAAWAADYLMRENEIKRVLIICPVSIMETAWRSDLFKTLMHRTVAIASGSREKRKKVVEGNYDFVIINFDGVRVVHEALKAAKFDLIIIDEGNAYKSTQTERWKAVAALLRPETRLWLMTGTPASQSPTDAYGLAKLVNPAGVPKFFGAFRDMVMNKLTMYKWGPKKDSQATVFKVLQPAIRFTKEECLDLPDILYTTREVPLTAQQEKYYGEIRKAMVAIAAGAEITAVNAAGMINKLLQISQGVAYTTEREVIEFDVSNRVDELMEVVSNTQHKVIVFVPFRHSMEKLQDELAKRSGELQALHATDDMGYDVGVIHGGVVASQRADLIKEFQTGNRVRILLLMPQAAAHGITLTKADTIVWWGPVTSAEMYLQGNARAHRAGQENKVTVVRLQGSPVEKRLYSMLDGKIDLHQGLVDLYKQEIG